MFETFSFDWLEKAVRNLWSFLAGLFTAVIGYMLPVKDIVHVVLFFFLMDIILGYWAAQRLRKEHFSTRIIWKYTMPRMLISIVLIISSYMWDTVFKQEFVSTYKIIGWFISGVLIYSIAKNGFTMKDSTATIAGTVFDANGKATLRVSGSNDVLTLAPEDSAPSAASMAGKAVLVTGAIPEAGKGKAPDSIRYRSITEQQLK